METIKSYLSIFKKRMKKIGWFLILLLLVSILAYIFKLTICPFRIFFGIPCPGCGMIRAMMAVLNLEINKAMYFHPLFILVPIIGFIVFFDERPVFKYITSKKWFWVTLFSLIMIIYGLRLFYYRGEEPMNYESNSILGFIIKKIRRI